MENQTGTLNFEVLKRKYRGIIDAVTRASLLFKVESYFGGMVRDNLNPGALSGKQEAVEILCVVKTEVEWRSLVRYLIDNEGFYQGNTEEGYFHKRGSPIKIQPVSDRDFRSEEIHRIA